MVARIVPGEQHVIRRVAERELIAERNDEGEANADIARRAADRDRIVEQAIDLDRRVDLHHRADAGAREPAEGNRATQIGVERRIGVERGAPELEHLVLGADRDVTQAAAMVVRIGQGRECDEAPAVAGRCGIPAGRRPRRCGRLRP